MAKTTITFLCIYFAVCLALFVLFQTTTSEGSVNSGFYIGSSVFIFVYVIADYKEKFNYLLMFSNTRKNIFISSAVTFTVMSIFLAVVSILSIRLDGVVSRAFEFGGSGHLGLLSLIYNSSDIAFEFLWFTTFFILICSFSMLYSSLAYKLGKVFITLFWICFGISWFILPIASGLDGATTCINALKAYFCISVPNGILLAPVNFIITTVIFGAAAYVISSRQPQVA